MLWERIVPCRTVVRLAHAPSLALPRPCLAGQVEWLRERVKEVPVRLVFESSLELMSSTQVGSFQVRPASQPASWPA